MCCTPLWFLYANEASAPIDLSMHGIVSWICETAPRCCTSGRLAINEIIAESQALTSCWPLRTAGHDGVFFGFFSAGTDAGNVSDDDVLITSHHTSPSTHTQKKKSLAPPHCPCQSPSPSFSCLSICSLVPGLEQRAIWARLPASSGGPLHRKDSFNSTSVCHDQRHDCLSPSRPPLFFRCLSACGAKTFHTLDGNYAKRVAHLPFRVSLRLCHFPALVFTRGASCILPDCFVLCFELF